MFDCVKPNLLSSLGHSPWGVSHTAQCMRRQMQTGFWPAVNSLRHLLFLSKRPSLISFSSCRQVPVNWYPRRQWCTQGGSGALKEAVLYPGRQWCTQGGSGIPREAVVHPGRQWCTQGGSGGGAGNLVAAT